MSQPEADAVMPAVPLAKRLLDMGCILKYHDPYVADWTVDGVAVERVTDLDEALQGADAAIIVQAHSEYVSASDTIGSARAAILDATGKFTGSTVERL